MKTICYYISDYGYGHAARSIGLIREIIAARDDFRIIAKTHGPYSFTRDSLVHPRVSVVDCRNDIEIRLDNSSAVDRNVTKKLFLSWMRSWNEYITRESVFCRENHVDMILSDISPQPFLIADTLGIPGIAISNFSWDTIFGHLFPDREEVGLLQNAYRIASCACILPFDIWMDNFPRRRRVGLVSRKITVSRSRMRRRLGIPNDEILIFIGSTSTNPVLHSYQDRPGRSDSGSEVRTNPEHNSIPHPGNSEIFHKGFSLPASGKSGIGFLVPSGTSFPGARAIPRDETESQNWLGMCDAIITKCGYSTVSEAVRARVPLLVWKREGFIEDDAIAGKIEALGIGKTVSGPEEGIEYCLKEETFAENYKEKFDTIDNICKSTGEQEILTILDGMMA